MILWRGRLPHRHPRRLSALSPAVVLAAAYLLLVSACSAGGPETRVPANRVHEVCLEGPGQVTLQEAVFAPGKEQRVEKLALLKQQIESKVAIAKGLQSEFANSEDARRLAHEAEQYASAVDIYARSGSQFSDALGDAILAEGGFYTACSSAME